MEAKKWHTSKTLWVNGAALVLVGLQAVIGHAVVDPELQAGLLAVTNAVLRLFTAKPLA